MGALVRVNAAIEKGGSGQKGAWVVSSTLQGSNRYLTGL